MSFYYPYNKIMINFAILGPGKISHRFMKGMLDVKGAKVLACASRDINKAKDYALKYNLEKYFGSYDEMLKDVSINAIYIATPPFNHYELIMKCLNAHKHVICEKPLMSDTSKVKECFKLAHDNNLVLMEANKGPYTPIFKCIKEILNSNVLGEIKHVSASYCHRSIQVKDHWVYTKDCAGALFDIGVYPLGFVLNLFHDDEIEFVKKYSIIKEGYSCDELSNLLIKFKNKDFIFDALCSFEIDKDNYVEIVGTNGRVRALDYWKGHKVELFINDEIKEYNFDFNSEFTFEIQEIVDVINSGKLQSSLMNEEMSIKIIDVINGVYDM